MVEIATKKFLMEDRRLDWSPTHDPRSLNYEVRETLGAVEEIPKTWDRGPILNQGSEGACVGFGWTAELMASPRPDPTAEALTANTYAKEVYYRAKQIDDYEGEDYSGTSVLAGAKVLQERGLQDEYRWALSVEDVRDAVISEGPVVVGVPWYYEMYVTKPSGLVTLGGDLVGGHCLTIFGYHPGQSIAGETGEFKVFKWQNSWDVTYGRDGWGYIRYEDLRDLLSQWGEACVPMGRKMVRLS